MEERDGSSCVCVCVYYRNLLPCSRNFKIRASYLTKGTHASIIRPEMTTLEPLNLCYLYFPTWHCGGCAHFTTWRKWWQNVNFPKQQQVLHPDTAALINWLHFFFSRRPLGALQRSSITRVHRLVNISGLCAVYWLSGFPKSPQAHANTHLHRRERAA